MSRRKLPYMRMYWPDYIADTGHLTRELHASYLFLIERYWSKQEALTEDEARRFSRMSSQEWAADRDVLAAFFEVADDRWKHKRIEAELRRVRRESKNARDAGRASALARKKRANRTAVERPLNDRSTNVEPQHKGETTSAPHDKPVETVSREVLALSPAEERLDEARALIARLEVLAQAEPPPPNVTRLVRRKGP